jgi:hypothetical protein
MDILLRVLYARLPADIGPNSKWIGGSDSSSFSRSVPIRQISSTSRSAAVGLCQFSDNVREEGFFFWAKLKPKQQFVGLIFLVSIPMSPTKTITTLNGYTFRVMQIRVREKIGTSAQKTCVIRFARSNFIVLYHRVKWM